MYYFTADFHFGHDRIIEFCNRPFKNASHMEAELIRNYNNIVTEEDIVFIIGDFSLKSSQHAGYYRQLLDKMNGQKHLILGNHDVENAWFHVKNGFLSVHTHLALTLDEIDMILVHDPAESALNRNIIFLCGHIHDLFITYKNVINVGVDVWDYKPISWERIKNILFA